MRVIKEMEHLKITMSKRSLMRVVKLQAEEWLN